MAALSSGRHGVGVYLVCPLSSAALAASLMNAGVSKSGSPAPKPTTSTPAFLSAAAFALTARVIDSEINFIRSDRGNMLHILVIRSRRRRENPRRRGDSMGEEERDSRTRRRLGALGLFRRRSRGAFWGISAFPIARCGFALGLNGFALPTQSARSE